MRKEYDSMGEVLVPEDKLYGAQTMRSLENFKVGYEKMPIEIIYALAKIKKAAAIVNTSLERLSQEKRDLIVQAADEILNRKLDKHFPLSIWQTGSGTQTNMNVNEVIANYASILGGGKAGEKKPIHPNDDVNMGQSSNDVFPSALHISACLMIKRLLLPNLDYFHKALFDKARAFEKIIKIGRTHMMDATPLTLGQEFSAFSAQILYAKKKVTEALSHLSELALGGTAVGTGLNTHPKFGELMAAKLSELAGYPFVSAPNKFEALATLDAMVEMSASLRGVGIAFMKVANDIRLLASGPRCGIGEIFIPDNEPGSSIMPGKVNPTQAESMTQVVAQVIGCDATIAFAAANSHLQLNVYRPVAGYNLLKSIRLLSDVAKNFTDKCIVGIRPNHKRIQEHLDNSLMLVTALNPHIGYDNAAKIAKYAYEQDLTLKEAALELGLISQDDFDTFVDPWKMIHPE